MHSVTAVRCLSHDLITYNESILRLCSRGVLEVHLHLRSRLDFRQVNPRPNIVTIQNIYQGQTPELAGFAHFSTKVFSSFYLLSSFAVQPESAHPTFLRHALDREPEEFTNCFIIDQTIMQPIYAHQKFITSL